MKADTQTRGVTSFLRRILSPKPPVVNIEEMRKHSGRGNFFRLFDVDDEIQKLKRDAHNAANPLRFEEALIEICYRFYEEGYAVKTAEA